MAPQPQVKKREAGITILPVEIIFNILILLPAHVLHNVMRYVCRQWRRIIEDPEFVNTRFSLATTSTLLMHSPKRSLYYLLDVIECHAKPSGFKFNIPSKSQYKYEIDTCNGLILIFRKLVANCTCYVGNPITRRAMALPRLSFKIVYCALAFEASSQVYKVVAVYEKWSGMPFKLEIRFAILTVDIDQAWRFLNCAHLTGWDMSLLNARVPPITSTGFLYWPSNSYEIMSYLDLKSERIKRISLPLRGRCTQYYSYPLCYLAKGNSISVWYTNSSFSMEVWLLKDYTSEEWVKILYIDGEAIRNELNKGWTPFCGLPKECSQKYTRIIPRSWYGKRILFEADFPKSHLFVYDLETCGGCKFDVEYGRSSSKVLKPFVNSPSSFCFLMNKLKIKY